MNLYCLATIIILLVLLIAVPKLLVGLIRLVLFIIVLIILVAAVLVLTGLLHVPVLYSHGEMMATVLRMSALSASTPIS